MTRLPNGRLLREHREKARLTTMELATKLGLSDSTIRNIEKGRNRNPNLSVLDKLADFFGFKSVDQIVIRKGKGHGGEKSRDRSPHQGSEGEGRP